MAKMGVYGRGYCGLPDGVDAVVEERRGEKG